MRAWLEQRPRVEPFDVAFSRDPSCLGDGDGHTAGEVVVVDVLDEFEECPRREPAQPQVVPRSRGERRGGWERLDPNRRSDLEPVGLADGDSHRERLRVAVRGARLDLPVMVTDIGPDIEASGQFERAVVGPAVSGRDDRPQAEQAHSGHFGRQPGDPDGVVVRRREHTLGRPGGSAVRDPSRW